MNVKPTTLNQLDNQFSKYTRQVARTPDMDFDTFIRGCHFNELEYKRNGFEAELAERFFEFVQLLTKAGKIDFAGIVCSRLVKFKNIADTLQEKYIRQAIEVAESQQDLIHVVSRLEDLHRYYEKKQDWNKLFKVLVKEEQVLKDIVDDFDTSAKNFRSVKYQSSSVENFESLLATIQINIAKTLKRKKPRKAILKLQSAMEIFKRLNDKEGYDFAHKLIYETEFERKK